MSLEKLIGAVFAPLIAALEANTAALTGTKPAKPAKPADDDGDTPPAKPTKPKTKNRTLEEVQALMSEVMEKCGKDKAVEIRSKYAKVKQLSLLEDQDDINATFIAAEKALAAKAAEGQDDDTGGDPL